MGRGLIRDVPNVVGEVFRVIGMEPQCTRFAQCGCISFRMFLVQKNPLRPRRKRAQTHPCTLIRIDANIETRLSISVNCRRAR